MQKPLPKTSKPVNVDYSDLTPLLVCFGLEHLDHINREWLSHYNFARPHQGKEIGNKVLDVDFRPADKGEVKRETKLGGIISLYYRAAA